MGGKIQYKTKQLEGLKTYMQSLDGRHVTVKDICEFFKESGTPVGTTTVYRHLDRMVKQGLVAKFMIEGSDSACFEYIGHSEKCHQPECFHCKCEKCGKLIHMECSEMMLLQNHMREHHGFALDSIRTVFFGTCSECQA